MYGRQRGPLTECKLHGHFPLQEGCRWCEDAPAHAAATIPVGPSSDHDKSPGQRYYEYVTGNRDWPTLDGRGRADWEYRAWNAGLT